MTVAKKLGLLAGIALTGIVLISVVLLRDIRSVYQAANFANDNVVPSLLVLDGIETNIDAVRLSVWEHAVTKDAAALKDIERTMTDRRQKTEQSLKAYEPLIADDKDREMLGADRSAISAFDAVRDKAVTLSRAGNKAEAVEVLTASEQAIKAVADAISAHRDYNVAIAKGGSDKAIEIEASALRIGLSLAILTAALVSGVAYFVVRQLTRQLGGEPGDVAAVAAKVAVGDFTSKIALRTGDESSLFATVAKMQTDLSERIQKDRAEAMENARIRVALDRVSVGALLADNEGTIIYLNDAMRALFRQRATDFRRQLPQFSAEHVAGQSFDAFAGLGALDRVTLSRLSAAHTADIKVGAASLRIVANPVTDTAGTRVGTVVQWIDRTQEVATEEEVQATVAKAVDGDLTSRIREEGKDGFFKSLAVGMNQLVDNMAKLVRTVSDAAVEVRNGAEEISRGNLNLSQRTEEQASSLEETASSMEEMTSTVKNNADNAAQANQLAAAARVQAEKGGTVVGAAVEAMNEINSASKKIADIIGVIDEIAFQTNLLALNAAVEAARAGDQGRGFAVVASEVRNLASRSAEAAKEIKGLIQDSVAKVTEGAKLVDESGRALGDIVIGVKKVTDVMSEIAASSQEQAAGVEQVNKAVVSMDEVTQQNAALVEEAAAAAEALSDQAVQLTGLLAHYRVGGAAGTTVSAPKARETAVPKPVPGRPQQERRSAGRPWARGAKPAAKAAVAVVPPATRSAAGTEGDWDEL
jgi:methyl-accepting chemotaxis protein